MRRKVIRIGIPKPVEKVIKSANAGRIPEFKTTEDGIKGIDLKLGSPIRDGGHFKVDGQQIRPLHAGRGSWFWPIDGMFAAEKLIGVGKIKIPETFDDVPSRACDRIRVRIMFTEIHNNKVLVSGMAARVNR